MAVKFANLASTTLASATTNSATSLTVSDASSFPSLGGGDYFYASIGEGVNSEIVKVTAVSSNALTVTRGQDGTAAAAHSTGTVVALRVVAAALDDIASQAQTAADTESVSIDGDTMTGDLNMGANRVELGSVDIYASGDSNSLHINAPTSVIPQGTTTASNPSLGLSSYRWDGVYTSTLSLTNIVTNKVVKFNGTILDDSNITDTGSAITLGSNTTVSGTLTSGAITAGAISSTDLVTENNTTKDSQGPYDWVTVGSGSRAAALRINDIAGANYLIRGGGYGLRFMKHVDAATDSFRDIMRFTATGVGDTTPHVVISNNLTVGGNLTVTGSISGALASSVTATTQSASDNSTKVATTAYVDSAVSGIVDSAPGTLDTLNELAAALGDDANFSTTVTNSIATKLPKAGGTMTGAINMGSNNLSGINNATAVSFLSTNGYWVGGTQRMNGSGDLVNIGTISSGAITSSGNITGAGLLIDGNTAVDKSGNYMVFFDGSGAPALYAGNTADNRNYYQSNHHRFRSDDASTIFAELSSAGLRIGGASTPSEKLHVESGNIRVDGAYKVNGATVINSSRQFYVGGGSIQHSSRIAFLNGSDGNTGSGAQDIAVRSLYAGTSYSNTAPGGMVNALNGYQVGNTTVIDSSRNLTNVKISRFGTDIYAPYISAINTNTLNAGYGDNSDSSDMWINYRGYQDGFTKFRDFRIGDGKGTALLFVDGSSKAFDFQNGSYLQMAGTTVIDSSRNITAGTITATSVDSSGAVTGSSFTADQGDRTVAISNGTMTMKGSTGGWAFGLHALGSSNTNHGGFGFYGGADAFTYYYIGATYNNPTNFRFYKSGQLNIGTNTILDSSRNLTNIGTISSGAITSSGTVTSATIHNTGVIYLGSTATANDQFAVNTGTDIFLGTTSKGLRTYKDLRTNAGNNPYWHAGHFANNSANWNTAYGWGNHASAGYLGTNDNITVGTISSGAITSSGNVHLTNGDVTIGDFSNTNTGSLYLRGSTANKEARLYCSNGNLHMDSASGNSMYLNYYNGSSIVFGNGSTGSNANIAANGNFTTSGTISASAITSSGHITMTSNGHSVNTRSVLARDTNGLVLGSTNGTTAISIDNSSNVSMPYNLTVSGTISSGAITSTGTLNLAGGAYEGSIVFGTDNSWHSGIRQHDDGNAEMRMWHKNVNGRIYIATGYDGEPSSISRPTDGLLIRGNRLGIGNFASVLPDRKLHVKTTDDVQILIDGDTSQWAGIQWQDSGGSSYQWYNGGTETWSLGGNGSSSNSEKRLHVHGGTSIGASLRNTTVPVNGLSVEGDVNIDTGALKVGGTTVINSARSINNVTLGGLATGARFEQNNWHQSSDGYNRFYFANANHTFYGTGNSFIWRNNGDVGVATMDSAGRMRLNTSGDQMSVGAGLQVGNNTFTGANGVYSNSRLGAMVNGALTSYVYASTYNDPSYPDYGFVFIHGPSTSNYNVWSISPDGPAKGNALNFIYGNGASNIHTTAPKVVFDGSGNVDIKSGALQAFRAGYQLRLRHTDLSDDDWRFYSWSDGLNIFPVSASSVYFGRDGATTDVELWNGDFNVRTGDVKVNGTTVIDSSRNLTNIGTASLGKTTLMPSGYANSPTDHAALNIGRASSGETRAIDIWGSWVAGESKSITANHGIATTQIVGQINFAHSPTSNTGGSSIRFGKLFHGGDSSLYTMELHSESTSLGYLNINRDMVQIGQDSTYTGTYATIGFGGRTNGYNRVFGSTGTADGLFLASATGRGVFVRTNGANTDTFSFTAAGELQVGAITFLDSARNVTAASGHFTSTYGGGSGDFTNVTSPPLKIQTASSFFRIPHISASSNISGVFNFEAGKDVYWGEPADTGNWYFRGRDFQVDNGDFTIKDGVLKIASDTVIDSNRNITAGAISSGAITSTSTSKFGNIRLTDSSVMGFGTAKSAGSVGHTTSDDEGIFWHSSNAYGIYRTSGAWSSPNYQQLKIEWATGIILNGGNGYGKSGVDIIGSSDLKMGGTTVIDSSTNGVFNNLRADGGNLIMGDEAYSTDADFVGMKTSNMSGSSDYMIISGLTDGNTYVSAKNGASVFVRGGGNNGSNQLDVTDSSYMMATTSNFYCTGNITAYYSSDKSLKENIRVIDSPIEKIKQIRGVYFDWTDDYIKEQSGDGQIPVRKDDVGVIAQEVKPVLDEVVTTRDDGTLAVRYEKMVALCIEAIKEQQDQIDSLKTIIEEMKHGNN